MPACRRNARCCSSCWRGGWGLMLMSLFLLLSSLAARVATRRLHNQCGCTILFGAQSKSYDAFYLYGRPQKYSKHAIIKSNVSSSMTNPSSLHKC
jgi:hypothetical protein